MSDHCCHWQQNALPIRNNAKSKSFKFLAAGLCRVLVPARTEYFLTNTEEHTMTHKYKVGDNVKWKWGEGWGAGIIKEQYSEKVTRKIKDTEVTRDASPDKPAYLIKQADGDDVLKSASEIEAENS